MASAHAGRLALVLAGILVLAACEPGQEFSLFGVGQSGASAVVAAPASPVATRERDVESPEVFQVADTGLWDGRPSLGGVWIAHPDVTDPERVLIRNQDNGKSVVGALFRRERENPGPRFQVSSDAAAELGMLAGAPSALSVVALRRVALPVIAEPVEILETDSTDTIDAESVAAATVAVIGTAETIEAAPVEPQVPIASIAASAIEAATANNPAASLPAATTATAAALQATASVSPVARPSTATLSGTVGPFIQIGVFSNQSDADDATDLLRASGIIPTVETSVDNGQTSWQEFVGPIGTPDDLTALLDQVQVLGFAGAFPVIR